MQKYLLIIGDVFAILITTLIGFITHGESIVVVFPRFLAAFVPLVMAWFLLAPWLGLFEQGITSNARQLWRPVFAMLFAAPFAAVLRSLILNTAILPVFAMVLAATSALGMLLWRGFFYVVLKIRLH